jgi:hypothetical protein
MSIHSRIEQLERRVTTARKHADVFEKKKSFDYSRFAENINRYVAELMEGRTPEQQEQLRQSWAEYLPPAARERNGQ